MRVHNLLLEGHFFSYEYLNRYSVIGIGWGMSRDERSEHKTYIIPYIISSYYVSYYVFICETMNIKHTILQNYGIVLFYKPIYL